jgi:hypothetical protein
MNRAFPVSKTARGGWRQRERMAPIIALWYREAVKVLNQPDILAQLTRDAAFRSATPSGVRQRDSRRHRQMGEGDQGREHQARELTVSAGMGFLAEENILENERGFFEVYGNKPDVAAWVTVGANTYTDLASTPGMHDDREEASC